MRGRYEVVQADLTPDAGWAEAMKDVRYVLHVASPMTGSADLVGPARDGTLRVLRFAVEAGVERVVMTSSCAAATPPGRLDRVVRRDGVDGPSGVGIDECRPSQLLAEQAAWEFMRDKETSLVTVLPGAVFGPVQSRDNWGSVRVIERIMGGMPGVPRVGLNIVDVRDVADLHIRAMTAPDAAGKRFIAVSEFMWMPTSRARWTRPPANCRSTPRRRRCSAGHLARRVTPSWNARRRCANGRRRPRG